MAEDNENLRLVGTAKGLYTKASKNNSTISFGYVISI
jgi:hypothetical protein